jgi:arylsulfatase
MLKRIMVVLAVAGAAAMVGSAAAQSWLQGGPVPALTKTGKDPQGGGKAEGAKPPYNILFVICDQESYRLFAKDEYKLPAREELARRGVTFHNHYIAAAVCTPSRAAFFTGTPPQVNGVFDHLAYGYTPNLKPDQPNMGSVLKGLGYKTAFFGKFELNSQVLRAKRTDNTSTALQPYGFDVYNPDGDDEGGVHGGYNGDVYIAGTGLRWLRENGPALRDQKQPFFMVMSFVNPHDVMFVDCNVPGQPPVQKALSKAVQAPPPKSAFYERKWNFSFPASLQESHNAPGMPPAIGEYDKGWAGVFGAIPTNRKDMWAIYYNYYLNCIRDNDRNLQEVLDTLTEMDLWKDTVVVFTADHGDMGGAHGGLRGKGPFCYEANSHVPFIVAHPGAKGGGNCKALTSHLDLLPTFFGLTGLPQDQRPKSIQKLPGHDFSALLKDADKVGLDKVRPGILFNYVQLSTIDANYNMALFAQASQRKPAPPLTEVKLDKRGFLAFVFDGRFKLARYYAPNGFNTPHSLDDLLKHNDVQVFDLKEDPDEMRNLALTPERNKDTILRLNTLLNDLMRREVGENDGSFLPKEVRPKKGP